MKGLKGLLSLVLVVALVLSVTACGGAIDPEGVATLVIANGEDHISYEVGLSNLPEGARGAISLLDYLKAEGKLDYASEDSGYGAYLTSVSSKDGGVSVKNDMASGTYIYIYTSVEADADVSEYKTEVEWEGKTLTSAGVGLSQMSVTDGAVIYITVIKY